MLAFLIVVPVALLLLAVFFGLLEHFFPAIRGQKRSRKELRDNVLWFASGMITDRPLQVATGIVVGLAVVLLAGVEFNREALQSWLGRETFISRQPVVLQILALFVCFDLIGYCAHRMFHRRGLLWRFHKVHHSSEDMYWLAAARVHPLNELGQRAAQTIPLLLAGFHPGVVAVFVPILTLWAIGLHANVRWGFGPLRYVIASPLFHRWHHTSEEEGLDRNFAAMFPWIDALFGTLYLPKNRQPQAFGLFGETAPSGYLRQFAWPFRRERSASATPPPLTGTPEAGVH